MKLSCRRPVSGTCCNRPSPPRAGQSNRTQSTRLSSANQTTTPRMPQDDGLLLPKAPGSRLFVFSRFILPLIVGIDHEIVLAVPQLSRASPSFFHAVLRPRVVRSPRVGRLDCSGRGRTIGPVEPADRAGYLRSHVPSAAASGRKEPRVHRALQLRSRSGRRERLSPLR